MVETQPKRWAVWQVATIPTMGSCTNLLSPLFDTRQEAEDWLRQHPQQSGPVAGGVLLTAFVE